MEDLKSKVEALEKLVLEQAKKLQRLEDIESIKKLQKAYGYYVERMMNEEIIDCFSDSDECCLNWLEGQWLGKAGVRRYFSRREGEAPDPLFQHQVMQIAGVVDVDPDGLRAKGRWYAFGGIFMPRDGSARRSLLGGVYEVEYIKEQDIWKMLKILWLIPYALRIPEGWDTPENVTAPFYNDAYSGPQPDIPVNKKDLRYVSGYILPFHYNHPVTGRPTSENKLNARLKPVKLIDQ